jgi:hypothetical protein
MIKLLICTVSAAILAICVLQLRQQRISLGHQTAELHDQVRAQQARLWNQQLQIATFTAPNAITRTVDSHGLSMVPQSPAGNRPTARWIDANPQQQQPLPRQPAPQRPRR